MVPQDPNNNRNLWERIETVVRDYAKDSGELYVVSGPIFYGSELKRIGGRVLVPTYLYKAVYDPKKGKAAAYVVRNEEGNRYAVVSIAELEKLSGLAVFLKLPDDAKKTALELPKPTGRKNRPVEDMSIIPLE
jgi:endonuclease G